MEEDRVVATNVIGWVFITASAVMVALRLVARLKLSNMKGWDDLWIVIAWLVTFVDTCLCSHAASLGMGRHLPQLLAESPEKAVEAGKWTVIALAGNIFVFTWPKPAIAVLLGRILNLGGKTSAVHRISLYGPAILVVLWSFATFGVWLGQCQPIEGLWNKMVPAQCLSPNVFLGVGMAVSSFAAFLDFYYGIYPIFFISKLQMDIRRKIHLSVMLGLGCIGGAIAIWKITQLPAGVDPDADVTWDSAALVYATLIEGNIIIIMACIPTMGPVFRSAKSKTQALRTGATRNQTEYQQFGDDDRAKLASTPDGGRKAPADIYDIELERYDVEKGSNRAGSRLGNRANNEIVAQTTVDIQYDKANPSSYGRRENGW